VILGGGLLGFLSLLLMAYCILDLATSSRQAVRGLPKPLWFPVLLVPLFGAAFWFLLGRPRAGSPRAMPKVLPDVEKDRAPDDDEAFLRDLRRRAEEQRREAEMQRRRDEEQQRRWAEEQKRRRAEGRPGRDEGDRPS
jgi:hypothetical protein